MARCVRENNTRGITWPFHIATPNPNDANLPSPASCVWRSLMWMWWEWGLHSHGEAESSRSSHWLLLALQPLMIYLFGNYRRQGELGTIDKGAGERAREGGGWFFLLPRCLCIFICMTVPEDQHRGMHQKANSRIDISKKKKSSSRMFPWLEMMHGCSCQRL